MNGYKNKGLWPKKLRQCYLKIAHNNKLNIIHDCDMKKVICKGKCQQLY